MAVCHCSCALLCAPHSFGSLFSAPSYLAAEHRAFLGSWTKKTRQVPSSATAGPSCGARACGSSMRLAGLCEGRQAGSLVGHGRRIGVLRS